MICALVIMGVLTSFLLGILTGGMLVLLLDIQSGANSTSQQRSQQALPGEIPPIGSEP